MKISIEWILKCITGKAIVVLVLAAMIGSIDVVPAIAKDGNKRIERHDKGRYEQRGRGFDRGRNVHNRRVYRHYGYSERVYYPPPVIYAPPPPPPGIGIFLPPLSIHF